MLLHRIRIYKEFAKSGIVTLVVISVFAGFFVGFPLDRPMDWIRLFETLIAVGMLASGSSALNQFQERERDRKMDRTRNRPLPSGKITEKEAIFFIACMTGFGLVWLWKLSFVVFALGCMAILTYNGFYTLYWKPKIPYAAIPGAIPGALPILIGYLAASQGPVFDPAGIYLYLLLFYWQMPHFWTLAIRFREDYEKGGFPVLSVARGSILTVEQIGIWSMGYIGLALIAPLFLHVGLLYLAPSLLMSIWILFCLMNYRKNPEGPKWFSFFMVVNFSLIAYLAFAILDLRGSAWLGLWLHLH